MPLAALFCSLAVLGCAEGAKLVQDTGSGGVVIYPFRENGHLLSPFRKDAFQLMKQRCAGSYRIIKEGETRGRMRIAGPVEGAQEVVQERRWGIQFECV